jgi:hypothetical protein
MSRRALRSTGSLGSVPPLLGYYDALRPPASPPRSLALARRFRLATERTGSPKFLGDPRHTCPGLRSRRSLRGRPPGLRPYAWPRRCCLPRPLARRPPQLPHFGIQFRSLRARCLRFVATVARVLLHGHARLASGWRPCLGRAGVEPAGSRTRFPSACWHHMASSWTRLAWRTEGPGVRAHLSASRDVVSSSRTSADTTIERVGHAAR